MKEKRNFTTRTDYSALVSSTSESKRNEDISTQPKPAKVTKSKVWQYVDPFDTEDPLIARRGSKSKTFRFVDSELAREINKPKEKQSQEKLTRLRKLYGKYIQRALSGRTDGQLISEVNRDVERNAPPKFAKKLSEREELILREMNFVGRLSTFQLTEILQRNDANRCLAINNVIARLNNKLSSTRYKIDVHTEKRKIVPFAIGTTGKLNYFSLRLRDIDEARE